MTPAEAAALEPDRLVISPGPGIPQDAGYSVEFVTTLGMQMPTLGVCLGHQAIAVAFGGSVGRAPEPRHGKVSQISHDDRGVFAGLANPFVATRYHSLAAISLPDVLEVAARSEDGVVQSVRHRELPITGVQFHPESIMTTEGMALLKNFLV
jgi:anthranilate synthase/aminodeoxychorismate synthase-like glutamine amidotransferase